MYNQVSPAGSDGNLRPASNSGSDLYNFQHMDQPSREQSTMEVQPSYSDRVDIEKAPRPVTTERKARKSDKPKMVIGADDPEGHGIGGQCLIVIAYIITLILFPFTFCAIIKVVAEYERAVIFRLGRLKKGGAAGPGMFCVVCCVDNFTKVDLRTVSFDVPPQEILTRDSVTVAVDAVVYFRASNPIVSVANVQNATRSTQLLAQTTLRTILGQHNLTELLSEREAISNMFQEQLDSATDDWGIFVERVEIKDVRLPVQLQRAMAAEAEATREAKAKVIAAEGEQKASRSLKEAADVISSTPSALQLRYLQTLNTISAERNSTIVFPFPIEFMSAIKKK